MSAAAGAVANSENRKIAVIRETLRREDEDLTRGNALALHRHRRFLAYMAALGFAGFGVGRDDVALTLARILTLAVIGGSFARALPLARVRAEALELGRLRGRICRVHHTASEGQCDRGREHRSCYRGFLHRVNLLSSLKSGDELKAPIFRDYLKRSRTSDLKITFAGLGTLCLPGFDLHRFDFVVDLVQAMLKFRRLDLHPNFAALTDDMSLAVLLDFPHQQGVLEAALRTGNVYRFVFKHIETSR
jgi:hypothetical protein